MLEAALCEAHILRLSTFTTKELNCIQRHEEYIIRTNRVVRYELGEKGVYGTDYARNYEGTRPPAGRLEKNRSLPSSAPVWIVLHQRLSTSAQRVTVPLLLLTISSLGFISVYFLDCW